LLSSHVCDSLKITDYAPSKQCKNGVNLSRSVNSTTPDEHLQLALRDAMIVIDNNPNTEATLRHLESDEFKSFVKTFKHSMRDLQQQVTRIADNTKDILI
jgi:hypothetical protein